MTASDFHDDAWDGPEFDGPSKSAKKREQLALQTLLEDYLALAPKWRNLDLPTALADSLRLAAKQKPSSSRNRQIRFSAKLLNGEGETTIARIKAQLDAERAEAALESHILHQSEHWRDRLLTYAPDALTDYLDNFPGQDIQQLRQLLRQSKGDSPRNKEARKRIFSAVREQIRNKTLSAE